MVVLLPSDGAVKNQILNRFKRNTSTNPEINCIRTRSNRKVINNRKHMGSLSRWVMSMAKAKKSENVPNTMLSKFDAIVAITDDFAKQHLNDEYAQLIRFATAALCRKRPSPLCPGS